MSAPESAEHSADPTVKGEPGNWPDQALERFLTAVKQKNTSEAYRRYWGTLALAEKLLAADPAKNLPLGEPDPRRLAGLIIAADLAGLAVEELRDAWLAPRVVEGFILPRLDAADTNPQSAYSRENLLAELFSVAALSKDTGLRLKLCRLGLAAAETDNRKLGWRLKLAEALDLVGEHRQALEQLEAIPADAVKDLNKLKAQQRERAERQSAQKSQKPKQKGESPRD